MRLTKMFLWCKFYFMSYRSLIAEHCEDKTKSKELVCEFVHVIQIYSPFATDFFSIYSMNTIPRNIIVLG